MKEIYRYQNRQPDPFRLADRAFSKSKIQVDPYSPSLQSVPRVTIWPYWNHCWRLLPMTAVAHYAADRLAQMSSVYFKIRLNIWISEKKISFYIVLFYFL